jgi:hypothetical protein
LCQSDRDDKDIIKEIKGIWKDIETQIVPALEIEGSIAHAIAKNFSYKVPSIPRVTDYFMRSCKKNLKRQLASISSKPNGYIASLMVNIVDSSINTCVSNLKASIKQDAILYPLIEEWYNTKSKDTFSEICNILEAPITKNATWANPGVKLVGDELASEIYLMRSYVQDAINLFFKQTKNPAPSSFICNHLLTTSTRLRRNILGIQHYEVYGESEYLFITDTSTSPEQLYFPDPTLCNMIKECYNISGEDFAKLIISTALSVKKEIPSQSESTLQKLLDYRCNKKFPFALRIFALYMRDYCKMGIPEILKTLVDPPFMLAHMTVKELSDYLNKLREKIREKLEKGNSNE